LTNNGKVWLAELRNNPKFKQVMKEFKELRPVVPQYEPQSSAEATAELIEKIKFSTGMKKGFDLIFQHLTGEQLDG
jgi:hypothetical protein